jgi:uncharacterized protein YyaL (SSP411 family)
MQIGVISPQDWGLTVADTASESPIDGLEASPNELAQRIRANTYEWLPRQFNRRRGAFHGFYRATDHYLDLPQTANLIASWQLLAAYDRYQDERLLQRARRSTDWFYHNFVVTHPMSVVIGGVRDTMRKEELWTKYVAEFVVSNLGIYRRTNEGEYLRRARQSAGFLIQATRHAFAPKYDHDLEVWEMVGWQSFGRVVEAFLELERDTKDVRWRDYALRWATFGLGLQADDGGFYLIDDEYFNTDLAASELRALVFAYEQTKEQPYLASAQHFADWLLGWQRQDGAWPLTIDRDGNLVTATVGPGDVPNIAIALLRLHSVTGKEAYLEAALCAFRYSLGTQAVPGSPHPHLGDPRVRWGFWSWDPYYDYSLSADQSTHHVRGMMFLLDYLASGQGSSR